MNVYHSEFALRSGIRRDVKNREFISGTGNIIYIDFLNRIYKESFNSKKRQERFISGSGLFLFMKRIIDDVSKKIDFKKDIRDEPRDYLYLGIDVIIIEIIEEDNIKEEYFLLPNIGYINGYKKYENKRIYIPQCTG